ncbi:MAG: hypothetical protein IJS14_05655 [Lentisphaeria bacterium]|nr:hypothetical protein [Lentisphaeria bacterium]
MFSIRAFKHPAARSSPAYFWGINAPMETGDLIAQLRGMYDLGVRSVCLHPIPKEFRRGLSEMTPPYLSEEYFAIIKAVVREAARLGMHYYLYDEGGWPSGSACGQVWASDPEHFTRSFAESDGAGGYRIVKPAPHPELNAPVPDLLARGATEKFLELTHEVYLRHLGAEHFGKTIRCAFTDEPVGAAAKDARLGWTADLGKEFFRRKGYELEPLIPLLTDPGMPAFPGTEKARALLDYRDVVSELFAERYLRPLREWCRRHGLLSGGHFCGEDMWFQYKTLGFGQILQSLRELDVPGVDMIWHQLYPGERLHPFPKLAASAAHQNGTRPVLSELFAVYGAGLQPRVMKCLLDYMLVCGVNTFVLSNHPQRARGQGMSSCRPHFGPTDPLWKYSGQWHRYISRMSALMDQGRAAAETAFYFDDRAMSLGGNTAEYAVCRCLKISDLLLEAQGDFDYIDDRMLRSAVIRKGYFRIGKAVYRRLVVPPASMLSDEAVKQLEKIRAAGIRVCEGDEPDAALPEIRVTPPTRDLRVTKRILGGGQAGYFVLNTSRRTVRVKLQIPERGPLAVADPGSGELFAVPARGGVWEWTFPPWGSVYFLTGAEATAEPPERPGKAIRKLDGRWRLRPLRRYFVGEREPQNEDWTSPAAEVRLGDWRDVLGGDFSGEAVYTLDFRCCEPGSAAFLDLGEVKYAVSVRLNGKDLGSRFWGPFVFPLGNALRWGMNKLEITVANTFANAVSRKGLLEEWRKKSFVTVYEPYQRLFEPESLASGLFGPVTLREKAEKR